MSDGGTKLLPTVSCGMCLSVCVRGWVGMWEDVIVSGCKSVRAHVSVCVLVPVWPSPSALFLLSALCYISHTSVLCLYLVPDPVRTRILPLFLLIPFALLGQEMKAGNHL